MDALDEAPVSALSTGPTTLNSGIDHLDLPFTRSPLYRPASRARRNEIQPSAPSPRYAPEPDPFASLFLSVEQQQPHPAEDPPSPDCDVGQLVDIPIDPSMTFPSDVQDTDAIAGAAELLKWLAAGAEETDAASNVPELHHPRPYEGESTVAPGNLMAPSGGGGMLVGNCTTLEELASQTNSGLSTNPCSTPPLTYSQGSSGLSVSPTPSSINELSTFDVVPPPHPRLIPRKRRSIALSGPGTAAWRTVNLGEDVPPIQKPVGRAGNGKQKTKDGRPLTEEEKKADVLSRNRQAAMRCRLRKKRWLSTLQEQTEELATENDTLRETVMALREEVAHLKGTLADVLAQQATAVTAAGNANA